MALKYDQFHNYGLNSYDDQLLWKYYQREVNFFITSVSDFFITSVSNLLMNSEIQK